MTDEPFIPFSDISEVNRDKDLRIPTKHKAERATYDW